MDKAQLRSEIQHTLLALQSESRERKSRRACQRLVAAEQFQNASTVMMFLSLPHEIDTSEAILSAWQLGKSVAGISTEASGLPNPTTGLPVPFGDIDLVVTPALAFDRNGNRLGRGGGFYDKFFAHDRLKACRCGFAYAEQIVKTVPATDHDQTMDMVVTDDEIIRFNDRKGE